MSKSPSPVLVPLQQRSEKKIYTLAPILYQNPLNLLSPISLKMEGETEKIRQGHPLLRGKRTEKGEYSHGFSKAQIESLSAICATIIPSVPTEDLHVSNGKEAPPSKALEEFYMASGSDFNIPDEIGARHHHWCSPLKKITGEMERLEGRREMSGGGSSGLKERWLQERPAMWFPSSLLCRPKASGDNRRIGKRGG